jgi:hypothetical protein
MPIGRFPTLIDESGGNSSGGVWLPYHRVSGWRRAVGSILGVRDRKPLKVMVRELEPVVAKCRDLLRFSSSAVR